MANLERTLNPTGVWALALGCIIGWGAFVMPSETFLPAAGPIGTAIAMAIAAIMMSIIAFNYHYMVQRFPVAGGEYVYADSAFGHTHGFICGWFLSLAYLSIVPLNATALALVGKNLMGNIFAVGYLYTVADYDIYAGEIALALGALVIFSIASIRGVKLASFFQTFLTVLLLGSVAFVFLAAASKGMIGSNTFSPAFGFGESIPFGILAVVAISPWAFVGFGTIPQAAGEFKFSPAKSRMLMVASILFGALVYVMLTVLTASAAPIGYDDWADYIAASPSLEGLLALPTFYAAYVALGDAGVFVLGIAVVCAILSGIIGFIMSTSRLLYSMAISERPMLPKWFARIHDRYKTPVNAILFVLIVSSIAPFFGRTVLGWIVDMSSLGAAIGFGYTSASCLYYAIKDGLKSKMVVTCSILGIIFSVTFAALLLVPIEGLSTSLDPAPAVCLCVWVALGIALYCLGSSRLRKFSGDASRNLSKRG